MDLGGQQSAFDTALTPGAGGLGRFQGWRLELWGWIVAHLPGAKVGIPHLLAAVSYIDYGEVLSICQHAQGSSGLELSRGRSLIWPPPLLHNPFIGQTQVCPLPYQPQSWGGREAVGRACSLQHTRDSRWFSRRQTPLLLTALFSFGLLEWSWIDLRKQKPQSVECQITHRLTSPKQAKKKLNLMNIRDSQFWKFQTLKVKN